MDVFQASLEYHKQGRPGKIEIALTKPCRTQYDLSLAYSPGVAQPCLEIEKNPAMANLYTARGNLVAVVSNGTAVLGLGDIGALAGKPVMEGKGVLFKRFADVDVFDIEIDSHNADEIIKVCQLLEPTFGGINLEDIKAPECFYIEETLKATMGIPVFHDDQHGTAIISGAGLINALEIAGKDISKVKVVFSGAGASGIACANMYVKLGVKLENVLLIDTKGVLYHGREDLDPAHPKYNKYKAKFANNTKARTLADALKDADVFCGCSVADVVSKDMVRSMAKNPIVFAMANPNPEISYPDAMDARTDVIMATGRSDYPNQVNNVLGFPFIFRGTLDTQATQINEEMKMAAAHSLAALAKEDVPDYVCAGYGLDRIRFGREYLIPKPIDHRVLLWEAVEVARAACTTGVARKIITDFEEYREQLEAKLGHGREITRMFINRAKRYPKRIVLPEGHHPKIIRAAELIVAEEIGKPIIIGSEAVIAEHKKQLGMTLEGCQIVDPTKLSEAEMDKYVDALWVHRRRKGVTRREARKLLNDPNYFGTMMLKLGEADALVSGVSQHYPDTIRPALQLLDKKPGVKTVAAMYAMVFKDRTVFLADTAVNIDRNDPESLAEIAILSADTVRKFDIEPRVAMLSFSNFGSVNHPAARRVALAAELVRKMRPDLIVDGEMQADTAVVQAIIDKTYPFSPLRGGAANTLIFPDMTSANIAYKLLMRLGGAEPIGPILMGMDKAVHVLQRECDVQEIVQIAAYAAVDAK
ncbi:NADP-dependent malic enzyme [bacterium]|nr:NADP-dependent malic enzyme [bacterium]MBU1985468.1 NADP-dependent malic enzyme [bacterium]